MRKLLLISLTALTLVVVASASCMAAPILSIRLGSFGGGVECEIPLNDHIGIVANGSIAYGVQDSLSYYSLSSLAAGLRYSPFPLSDRIRPYLCAYGGFFRELVGEYVDIYHPLFVPLAAAFVGVQINSSSGSCYGLEVGYLWAFRPGQAAEGYFSWAFLAGHRF